MAKRSVKAKQVKRMRKALRVSPPAFLDLIEWLQSHRHAQTADAAREIILAGRVRHGSHTVGIVQVNVKSPNGKLGTEPDVYPFVPAEWRADLIVV